MKAAVYTRYGPPEVLQLREIEKPAPRPGEVLVKVIATTVTTGDVRMRAFQVPRGEWVPARLYLGVRGPRRRVLGMELAGVVEAAGPVVTRFREGDRVFASTFGTGFGGYAEYKCLPANAMLDIMPAGASFEVAATLPVGGATAVRCLRKGGMRGSQRVLIYGASGSVGSFAVQIARHWGAEVTAVCSAPNLEWVKALGAERCIDYTVEDFARRGETWDVVFDAVGKASPPACRQALSQGGTYLSVLGSSEGEKAEDLTLLRELVEEGALRPAIDRSYPLEQIVEAHRYVEAGHKRGNVVITVGQDGDKPEGGAAG